MTHAAQHAELLAKQDAENVLRIHISCFTYCHRHPLSDLQVVCRQTSTVSTSWHSCCSCVQSSLQSEMQNMSFTHISSFTHRHFTEAHHDFQAKQRDEFLRAVAADMANEAAQKPFATAYIKQHKHPVWDAAPECDEPSDAGSAANKRRLRQRRKDKTRTVPKHFYVNDFYRSDYDRGKFESMVPLEAVTSPSRSC